ncbi:hypothetical protein JQ621_34650 [Bradyrhizobium manausense]|uniref:DUF6841 family protein n=1 Tax=Bradyrhizobium manausense TaxID=989370 RepID=UPI001BA657A4|nr:hypothetical protein [Bradyrhizobium manausense]MBR1092614.1 hypothetical protein [Bradyrhizobium manausense]
MAIPDEEIHAFMANYYEAFSKDATAGAEFYAEPSFAVLPNCILYHGDKHAIVAFLAMPVQRLRPLGYAKSEISDPHIQRLNKSTVLYFATTIRKASSGAEIERGRYCYQLHKSNNEIRIVELIAIDCDSGGPIA